MISVENLSLKTKESFLLKDINLSVKQDQCLSILGKSGSGKSTLLLTISGLIQYSSGDIYYNGKKITEYNIFEYRKKVRYIPPKPEFVKGKVYEHFSTIAGYLNCKTGTFINKIIDLLPQLNLEHSILDKDTGKISTGEGKRLLLIQNLVSEAEIFLLDEVFTGLDPELVDKGFNLMSKNAISIIICSHNIPLLKKVSNASIFIDNGKITGYSLDFYSNEKNPVILNYLNGGN